MIEHVENKLVKYCCKSGLDIKEASFLISLSGGLDSMVLSTLLISLRKKYNYNLYFAHFNHKIHSNADIMVDVCRSLSLKNNIPIYFHDIYVPKGKNFECYSRECRYRELNKISVNKNINFILTAHHYDDQIETLFMKNIDNSDWISKIGIRETYGLIRRPMLELFKKDLYNYAKINNIIWIEDPTNKNLSFKRNEIRHSLLPKAVKKNLNLPNELIEKSFIYKKRIEYFLKSFDKHKKYIFLKKNKYYYVFNLKELQCYQLEKLKFFIYWISSKYINVDHVKYSKGYWLNFKKYLTSASSGSIFNIGPMTLLINRDELYITKCYNELLKRPDKIKLNDSCTWYDSFIKIHNNYRDSALNNSQIISLPFNLIKEGLYVRRWKNGDRIKYKSSKNKLLVSDIFIKNKISIIGKLIYPIIVNKLDEIIWIPGLMLPSLKVINLRDKRKIQIECVR